MDVDSIALRASEIRPGRTVGRMILTAVAAVFYAIGWTAGFASVCVAWSIASVQEGWSDARAPLAQVNERRRGAA